MAAAVGGPLPPLVTGCGGSAGGVQNNGPTVKGTSGDIHMSSRGIRPRDSTRPGVDWLRPIAATEEHIYRLNYNTYTIQYFSTNHM